MHTPILSFSGKKLSLATLILAGLISLQGCGGSRDEPFNPDDGDGNEDVDTVVVPITLLEAGTDARLAEDDLKRLQVMREESEFFAIYDNYSDGNIEAPDFTRGQVILYDPGLIDNNPCADKLIYRNATAQEENGSVVKVTLELDDYVEETGANCTNIEQLIRPYRFMFVESREKLIFSEEIRWPSSSSSSSRSSSSSSSSSSSTGF